MINLKIDENFKDGSGIYMIKFSNGMFYIGCTSCFKQRLSCHNRSIKRNFNPKTTPLGLQKMKDFEGDANFIVIEYFEIDNRFYKKKLLDRERYYLDKYRNEPLLLNNRIEIFYNENICLSIKKELKDEIERIAKLKNISTHSVAEELMLIGLKKYC